MMTQIDGLTCLLTLYHFFSNFTALKQPFLNKIYFLQFTLKFQLSTAQHTVAQYENSLCSQRPFHFHCSFGTLFVLRQTRYLFKFFFLRGSILWGFMLPNWAGTGPLHLFSILCWIRFCTSVWKCYIHSCFPNKRLRQLIQLITVTTV